MYNTWQFLMECKLVKSFWNFWVLALLLKLWREGCPRWSQVWAPQEDGASQPHVPVIKGKERIPQPHYGLLAPDSSSSQPWAVRCLVSLFLMPLLPLLVPTHRLGARFSWPSQPPLFWSQRDMTQTPLSPDVLGSQRVTWPGCGEVEAGILWRRRQVWQGREGMAGW